MCGRYFLEPEKGLPEIERIRGYIQRRFGDEVLNELKTGEVLPGDLAPVLLPAPAEDAEENLSTTNIGKRPAAGAFIAWPMRWGFPNFDKKLLINARAETAAEKPSFREAVHSGRCVIPTSGFVEYSHDSRGRAVDKFRFNTAEPGMLYLAGLVLLHEGQARFVILTTEANDSMQMVHHRMPVVLEKENLKAYLNDTAAAQKLMSESDPQLLYWPAAR